MFIRAVELLPLIVPPSKVGEIYNIQEVLCILIIAFLAIISIFELKAPVKIALSIISVTILSLHYYVLLIVSRHAQLLVLPLFVVESTEAGSTISIDYGQLMAIFLVLAWRRELSKLVRRVESKSR